MAPRRREVRGSLSGGVGGISGISQEGTHGLSRRLDISTKATSTS